MDLRERELILLFFFVVLAVVSRFAVVARRDRNLRKLATALRVVVILARRNVTQNSLLVLHDSPPARSLNIFEQINTAGINLLT